MRKKLRYAWVRLLRAPGAPREIAGGVALGLFVAMLPTVGGHTAMALVVVELARRLFRFRLSRVAAVAGVWITNPLTAAPLYGLSWLVGRPLARAILPAHLLAGEGVHLSITHLASAGPFLAELLVGLTLGGIVIGAPLAFLGYRLTLRAAQRYQARKASRRKARPAAEREAPVATIPVLAA